MGLFGSSSGKKARAIQRQQIELAKQQFEYNQGLTNALNSQYDAQLTPLLNLINGNTVDSNTPYGQTQQNLQSILDVLTGKTTTAEQQRYDSLSNNYINQLTGANKTAEQQTADEWNSRYLNSLANNPDTAFNSGVAQLEQGYKAQQDALRKQMQARGIGSSGMALNKIGATEADKARDLSQLQGQKADRQTQNAGIGAQFAQNLSNQQQQNYDLATKLASQLAQNKQNNLTSAANMSNNYSQQLLNNIMGVLGGKSGLIDHNAYNSYQNAMGNLAANYQQEADSQSNLIGGLISAGLQRYFPAKTNVKGVSKKNG